MRFKKRTRTRLPGPTGMKRVEVDSQPAGGSQAGGGAGRPGVQQLDERLWVRTNTVH